MSNQNEKKNMDATLENENTTLSEAPNETVSTTTETLEEISPIENVEPEKPSLDSILNGEGVGDVPTPTPTSGPTILESTPVETLDVQETPKETIEENIVSPQTEEVPVEPLNAEPLVVEEAPTPEIEETSTQAPVEESSVAEVQNAPVEAPVVEEVPKDAEPVVNATENSAPVIETIEDATPTPTPEEKKEEIVEESVSTPSNETMVDDFNAVPTPPTFDDKKKSKKEGNSKSLILLLVVLLIVAVGLGVYYFLNFAKKTTTNSLKANDLKVELGSVLSNDVSDYATISGYNEENCTVDLNSVNVNQVSTYKFTVTCGKASEEGTIIVDDTKKPEVVTNDVILLPNATLNVEDFIDQCNDASKCSYEFQNDVSTLTSQIGEYDVTILVSDEYNNQTTVTAKLTVASTAPARYLTCQKESEELSDLSATLIDTYKVGIDNQDNFYNATRIAEFTFKDMSAYNQVVSGYEETVGIHSIIGKASFNESNQKVIIKADKTMEELNKELNGTLPKNANIIRAFLSGLGYICN